MTAAVRYVLQVPAAVSICEYPTVVVRLDRMAAAWTGSIMPIRSPFGLDGDRVVYFIAGHPWLVQLLLPLL